MKTVKRHAKAEEKVLITEPWGEPGETYSKGDVFVVKKVFDHEFEEGAVLVDGMDPYPGNTDGYLAAEEYEVIVE